jgi:enamine deaminase RidA (YjgF/YER057c/UK114 family)
MAEQTRQAIRNMQTVLEAAGGSLSDIVSIVVYTTDIRQFKEIVAARMEFFQDKLPTSTIVEVNHLADPGLLIEFQATAAL